MLSLTQPLLPISGYYSHNILKEIAWRKRNIGRKQNRP